jgi:ABC-2 type transport system ATP-binding protein
MSASVPETEPVIHVRGAMKSYRPLVGPVKRVLDGIDLDVHAGEVLGLIGANGAGKTTLLTCLLGLQRVDRGDVRVLGRPVDALYVRARTGYLPERLGFDRDRTGRQFLALHARLAGVAGEADGAGAERLARRVDLDPAALRRPLKSYSRGMLQRIGLAQALLGRPALLFLDEPTSGLDPVGVPMMRRVIGEARQDGATVVLNSHQLDEVERVCDRVAFVEGGRVRSTASLHASPAPAAWHVAVGGGRSRDAEAALRRAGIGASAIDDGTLQVEGAADAAERIAPVLVAQGIALRELTPRRARLEALFFEGGRGARDL